MKLQIALLTAMATISAACSHTQSIRLTVADEVVNAQYIGNGVEWDPYDEADAWGNPISEEDWQKLYARLDYMNPAYVRCMINSPYRYYDAKTGKYLPQKNLDSMTRLLDYCQRKGIMVVFGEYNPPEWSLKTDQKWVDMAVDYLNMLVIEKGYDCIKHFVIFNEPDGDWASTNGDFQLWLSMVERFHKKMSEYPGLLEKVSLAGPDVVADYKNANSDYDTSGWLEQSAAKADSLIGLYDIHAYPGQAQVRDGSYCSLLKSYRRIVPADKKIILGEAGYKYWRQPDSLLMAEYNRRVEGHPYTKGSDCNMLVYDNFYAIDMPLLIAEVMNAGFDGVAAWMLDDAMHSQGDSGKPEDIKIWGMWNILGEDVFGDPAQEDVRPWYYTWSLMCRYFPKGCNVLKTIFEVETPGVFAVAAYNPDNKLSIALINVTEEGKAIAINLPGKLTSAKVFKYTEKEGINLDANNLPRPEAMIEASDEVQMDLDGNSMLLITEMD